MARNSAPWARGAAGCFGCATGRERERAQPQDAPHPSKPAKSSRKAAATAAAPALEPKAIDILKAASNRLAGAHSMTFTSVVTYESPSRLGPPLAYMTRSEVTMERPDQLRVITLGDGPRSDFYYNGKTMMAFAPAEDLVAVAPAPPTIDAALKAAYDNAAIYFPFSDVIVTDPYKDIAKGLKIAFYIGQSNVVGGITTDMVAYANDAVFIQIRIGARKAAAHAPRRVPQRFFEPAPPDGALQLATRPSYRRTLSPRRKRRPPSVSRSPARTRGFGRALRLHRRPSDPRTSKEIEP